MCINWIVPYGLFFISPQQFNTQQAHVATIMRFLFD